MKDPAAIQEMLIPFTSVVDGQTMFAPENEEGSQAAEVAVDFQVHPP
jgi:hypothetical protein